MLARSASGSAAALVLVNCGPVAEIGETERVTCALAEPRAARNRPSDCMNANGLPALPDLSSQAPMIFWIDVAMKTGLPSTSARALVHTRLRVRLVSVAQDRKSVV